MKNHLVRTDVLLWSFVQVLVSTVLIVIIVELQPIFDGIVNKFNVIEKRLIISFAPVVNGINMFDMGFEVSVWKGAKAINQVFWVLGIDMLAAEYAVNQQTKLGIFKVTAGKIASGFAWFNFKSGLFEQWNIAADGSALNGNAIFALKVAWYFFLGKWVIAVAVFFENL